MNIKSIDGLVKGPSTGREESFQIIHLQKFEMIDELFTDTVVICHHEKIPNNLIADGEINCRSGFHSRQIDPLIAG